MDRDLAAWHRADRHAVADWIGDRPETVLATHAVLSGHGRAWCRGPAGRPEALVVEAAILPGEPMAFGPADAVANLLAEVPGLTCVEGAPGLIDQLEAVLTLRWGSTRRVTDVVHELPGSPPADVDAPISEVRQIEPDDILHAPRSAAIWPPAIDVVIEAATRGRVFGVLVDGVVVAQAGSYAASARHADISVHVAPAHRAQRLATAAAWHACRAVWRAGLVPVWGAGEHNTASLRVAHRLGFVETTRLTYLVRAGR